jgi:hypothetical protein
VANRLPTGITAGPDGNLWFTERNGGAVGQMDTTGALLNEFVVPALTPNLQGIAQGPDGNLWFAESGANRVGRITTDGTITEFVLPNAGSQPFAVTGGPDDGVWFTEQSGNRIGRAVSQEPDTTPPTVTITTPADGAVFAVGDEVLADYGCVDEPGGSGVDACHGPVPAGSPIDTSLGVHTFTVHASDVAGNLATASTTYEVVDVTPPTITITVPADGALFAVGDVVAADYGCADEVGGSGLATCDGPVADGEAIDTTLGTHTFTVDATDVAGNPASASTTYEVVAAPSDTTPPTVTITTPAEASVYSVGQVVKADFACADEGGGSGLLTCAGTVADGSSIDTTLGTHVFTVTATDGAGNTVTVSTHYAVLSGLSGSLLPYPTLNVESAGTALPVTFDLGPAAAASASTHTKTGSARPRALETVPPFAAGYPASQQVDCDAPNVALGPLEPADVNAQLSKTGRLHVVWKTRQSWAGTCRAFAMRFDLDGWRDAPVTFLVHFTP